MGRACCVPGCDSGKKVPSHRFPKNVERCMQWLETLQMNTISEPEIHKLRICHKHFHNSDYSCSPKLRVLKNTAIPFINITEQTVDNLSVEAVSANLSVESVSANLSVEAVSANLSVETFTDPSTEVASRNTVESASMDVSNVLNVQTINNRNETENSCCEDRYKLLERKITEQNKNISTILTAQQEGQQEIYNLKNQMLELSHMRPELKEITRKNLLSPDARQFYDKIVKLKKDKRRLKRCIGKIKIKNMSKIGLNAINSKGRVDNTASVRQQFINMMLRNNDVAPQVNLKYFKSSVQ